MHLAADQAVFAVVVFAIAIGLLAGAKGVSDDIKRKQREDANEGAPTAWSLPPQTLRPLTPPRHLDMLTMGDTVLLNGGWRSFEVSFLDENYLPVSEPALLGPALTVEAGRSVRVISITVPTEDVLGAAFEEARRLLTAGDADGALRVLNGGRE